MSDTESEENLDKFFEEDPEDDIKPIDIGVETPPPYFSCSHANRHPNSNRNGKHTNNRDKTRGKR